MLTDVARVLARVTLFDPYRSFADHAQ